MKSVWAEIGEEIAKNERERIREEGIDIGRLETLKENAASMRAEGWSDETIAKILRVDAADVRIWLDSNASE